MKKYQLSLATIIAFSFLIITGCQSDPEELPAPKTKTELLMSSPWVFQSASASGIGDVSGYSQLTCFKDNIMTFTSVTAGNINEGAIICSPSNAGAFTWNFATNETVLNLSGPIIPGGSGTFTVISLNETNLVVSQNVNFPPSVLVTVTFKH